MSDEGVRLQAAIGSAIEGAMPGFTIKWFSVVEVSNLDGERELWTFCSPDAKRWDILGLLEYCKQIQQGYITRDDA